MMNIRHFDVMSAVTPPPREEGWEHTWAGYYAMKKCVAPSRRDLMEEQERTIHDNGEISETEFEKDCLLSILAEIKGKHVNMFELGAGWGRGCLNLAGIIDNKLISLNPISYRCLGVEAEPTHYQWLKEHFEVQKINGEAVYGAVSNKNGSCWFYTNPSPDSCYGQSMESVARKRRLRRIRQIYRIITKRSIRIPTYTIDHLIRVKGFKHVDIIDIDVQGAEYQVVAGAAESIMNDLIDYWIIGTHHGDLNNTLKQLLNPKYDLVINLYPRTTGKIDGFAPIRCQDGTQIYKRKNM